MNELATPRLRLRRWRPTDRDPFAAMNADAQVMEHFPAALSCEESDALASAIEHHFVEHGFGLWAVEILVVAPFAGFVMVADGSALTMTEIAEVVLVPPTLSVALALSE